MLNQTIWFFFWFCLFPPGSRKYLATYAPLMLPSSIIFQAKQWLSTLIGIWRIYGAVVLRSSQGSDFQVTCTNSCDTLHETCIEIDPGTTSRLVPFFLWKWHLLCNMGHQVTTYHDRQLSVQGNKCSLLAKKSNHLWQWFFDAFHVIIHWNSQLAVIFNDFFGAS